MKYVYTNITGTIQSVLLASKKQDSVNPSKRVAFIAGNGCVELK